MVLIFFYFTTKTPSKLLIAKLEAGLRQSNFNGNPNVKRTCLPTGRMAQCRMQNAN